MNKLSLSNTNRIGLGCMGMSEFYGENSDESSLQILLTAFDIGYRHFDTADMYGKGHNESLIGQFVKKLGSNRKDICIATKVGIKRDASGAGSIEIDSSPEYIISACDNSLRRLGVEQIDLYYLHRRQRNVPIEETMGAMEMLYKQGKIAAVGLSEVSADTLIAAHKIIPITAIQSEYSLWSRDVEKEILPACIDLGVNFVAYSPIGRGFLSGKMTQDQINTPNDLRSKLPRFQPEAFASNELLLEHIHLIANRHQASAAQISLAWLLAQHNLVHVIPGARKINHLNDNASSKKIVLTLEEIHSLNAIFARENVVGERYPEMLMHTTNA
jgi:aryl-alcohol dehydrogenase-like predicted oxidoreductase